MIETTDLRKLLLAHIISPIPYSTVKYPHSEMTFSRFMIFPVQKSPPFITACMLVITKREPICAAKRGRQAKTIIKLVIFGLLFIKVKITLNRPYIIDLLSAIMIFFAIKRYKIRLQINYYLVFNFNFCFFFVKSNF